MTIAILIFGVICISPLIWCLCQVIKNPINHMTPMDMDGI